MKRTVFLIVPILGAALAAASSAATSGDVGVRATVERELEDAGIVNGGGPAVEVAGGVVTLTGKVRSLWAKDEAIRRALDVEGVRAVEDELEIAFAESDEKLAAEIAGAIRSYVFFTIFDDVSLGVEDGNVLLSGRVTMPFKSDEIAERVAKVAGVQSLTNEVRTLPTNIGDRRIRADLAYRIYRDSLFDDLVYRRNPPVHIVVERGRVVLTGAVRSEVERRRAEHIARSTFGVFSVENRLVVGG